MRTQYASNHQVMISLKPNSKSRSDLDIRWRLAETQLILWNDESDYNASSRFRSIRSPKILVC